MYACSQLAQVNEKQKNVHIYNNVLSGSGCKCLALV